MFRLFDRSQPTSSQDKLQYLARTLETVGVTEDDPELCQQILANAAEIRARSECQESVSNP